MSKKKKEHVKYEPIFRLTYGLAAFIAIFHVDFGYPNKFNTKTFLTTRFFVYRTKWLHSHFFFYEITQSHFTAAQIPNGNALNFFTKRTVEFIGGWISFF